MPYFPNSLSAWQSTEFQQQFLQEAQQLNPIHLPLVKCMQQGSFPTDKPATFTILDAYQLDGNIYVKTGVFFSSVIAGCSCADDPTPIDEISEYGELLFIIDNHSAEISISVSDDY